jgi:geranylgeranyl diphosphate synthase, type II
MDAVTRIEQALVAAVGRSEAPGCPPKLAAAMRHAVFPRGARVRPRICLAVAGACGEDNSALTDAAAASLELLHCASLVHDDMPCFDDAATRRGRPSVFKAFGEPLALLTGDALIVLAFQTLSRVPCDGQRLGQLVMIVSRSVGVPLGIVAGQAWECESDIDLAHYHRAKTGALFAAATMAGAAAAGADTAPWRQVGELIGEAYQAADDIRDAVAEPEEMGKPAGQDALLGRPSLVAAYGVAGAVARLEALVGEAIAAIPDCPGAGELRALILSEAARLRPKKLSANAA